MKIRAPHKQTPPTTLMSFCLVFAALSSSCGGGSSSPDSSPTPPTPATATLVVVLASPSSSPVSVSVDASARRKFVVHDEHESPDRTLGPASTASPDSLGARR